jgi:hypothetical protein
VIHNGRFSLPAGRYRADVEWSRDAGEAPLGLQVGRIEPELEQWTVRPAQGRPWSAQFDLPADANFVAFRGSPDLERTIQRLTITPLSVIDESARGNVPMVLAARRYGAATVLFHDERSFPEPTGFWVLGQQRSRVTVARGDGSGPLVLRVHSGTRANRVTFSMRGWQHTLTLEPGAPQPLTVPDSERRLLTLDISPEDGFRPIDSDSSSRDMRFLGVWVELPGSDQP